MKNKFVLLLAFLACFAVDIPHYNNLFARKPLLNKNDEADFDLDKWLEDIGIKDEPTKEKEDEPEEITAEEKEEIALKVIESATTLEKFKNRLASLTQYALDITLFGPDFRENIDRYIQTGTDKKATTVQKTTIDATKAKLKDLSKKPQTEESEKEFFDIMAQITGVNGLLVLIPAVLSGDTYLEAFVHKKHKNMLKTISEKSETLKNLKDKIKKYKEEQEEIAEEERLRRLIEEKRIPKEEERRKMQQKLQTDILTFYKALPTLINRIKTVFADPDVQTKIKEERIRRGKITPTKDYPHYPSYPRADRWPRRYDPRKYEKGIADQAPDFSDLPPLAPLKEEEDLAAKDDKKDKKWSPVKKKKKDKKKVEAEKKVKEAAEKKRIERAKSTELFEKAIKLINEICTPVTIDHSVVGNELRDVLFEQHEKINSLLLTVNEISKRKITVTDKEIKATEKKKTEEEEKREKEEAKKKKKKKDKEEEKAKRKKEQEKREHEEKIRKSQQTFLASQQKFYKAFSDNIEKMLLLCKYGYADTDEKPDGLYMVVSQSELSSKKADFVGGKKLHESRNLIQGQENMRTTYAKIKSLLPKTDLKAVTTKETAFQSTTKDRIDNGISNSLQRFNGVTAQTDITPALIGLNTRHLKQARKEILRVLQYHTASTNRPLPIKINAKNVNIVALQNAQMIFSNKFSQALQKILMAEQQRRAQKILKTTRSLDIETIDKTIEEHIKKLRQKALVFLKQKQTKSKALDNEIFGFLPPEKYKAWIKHIGNTQIFNLAKEVKKTKREKKETFLELRKDHQYRQAVKNFNELDKLRVVINVLQKESHWWTSKPKAPHNVEIVEALWTWEKPKIVPDKKNKKILIIEVPNPQVCDVRTFFWQELVNGTIDDLKAKTKKTATFKLPDKIETKMFADLSDRGKNEKKIVIKKFHEKLQQRFKHFFTKIKQFFRPVKKEYIKERYLLLIYKMKGKTYHARFTGDKSVTLNKEDEIKPGITITWRAKIRG